jgi:uncharacterized membrane protein YeaQ/YmgE (transglycosylase-associated protein family)
MGRCRLPCEAVLILGIIGFGALIGAAAQLILGRGGRGIDWGMAIAAGLIGSFVGGLIVSLLAGDGLAFRPSGVIGSILGALIVTLGWRWLEGRKSAQTPATRRR